MRIHYPDSVRAGARRSLRTRRGGHPLRISASVCLRGQRPGVEDRVCGVSWSSAAAVCRIWRRSMANRVAGPPSTTLWSTAAVDDVVVDGECQIEDVAKFDPVPDGAWLPADSADDQEEGRQRGWGNGVPAAVAEHADRGDLDGAGGEVDSPGSAHAGVHQRVQTGHVSQGGPEGGQQAAAGGGARVGLDGPYLGADVGDAADVGVADDLDEPERSLAVGISINVCTST